MAYIKIKGIKTGTHLQQSLDYIKNPDKTDNGIYISSFACSTNNTAEEFEETLLNARNYGNNIAHHICQSFSIDDNITPEQALAIGQKMMKQVYPSYQYIICTHIDRQHIHNHIIVCAANFKDFKKIHSNKDNLDIIRKSSDELCKENGLTVIKKEPLNKRERLKKDIDAAIENTNTYDEFLGCMQAKKYEIKQGKYLYFKGEYGKVFLNTKLLGSAYTEKNIRKRIANHTSLANHKVHIYDDKIVKMSYHKRLKYAIDNNLKKANDYDDFLRLMHDRDYEIKFGKHLAFKHITASRYIRCDNLSPDYTEEMLKLYFADRESYDHIKKNMVDKIITSDKAYRSKYIEVQNVNIQIRMLNYLREHNIKSYDELLENIEKCQKKVSVNQQNIQTLNTQIAEKREIIKSLRAYWQYKPYISGLYACKTENDREKYKADNKAQLERFEKAVEVINRSKNPNGTLPKAVDLNLETEKRKKLKERIETQNLETLAELNNYKNLQKSLDDVALNKKTIKIVKSLSVDISPNM